MNGIVKLLILFTLFSVLFFETTMLVFDLKFNFNKEEFLSYLITSCFITQIVVVLIVIFNYIQY